GELNIDSETSNSDISRFFALPDLDDNLVQIARTIRWVVLCTDARDSPASPHEHCCPQQDGNGLEPKTKLRLHNGGAGADIAKPLAKSGTAGYQPADQVKAPTRRQAGEDFESQKQQ